LNHFAQQITCHPIIMHRDKIALEKLEKKISAQQEDLSQTAESLFQSASLLPSQYSIFLNPHIGNIWNIDAMYTLTELFNFALRSENQFLNKVKQNITQEVTAHAITAMDTSTANLKYMKALLDEHIGRLEDTIKAIENRGDAKWPKVPKCSDPSKQSQDSITVDEAIQSVLTDYQCLLSRAKFLTTQCIEGMMIMGNNAQLEEARKGMLEAERTRKLTILAFFYLPLSLTTGIFGMNVTELGQGNRSAWVAVVVCVIIFIVTTLMFSWELLERAIKRYKSKRLDKINRDGYTSP
jgi:hypothetical protein